MNAVRPVAQFGRAQEHGRIRTGHKVQGKKGMEPRTLNHFRLTSTDREALTILAARYGGEPRPWNEPRAAVRDGWELYTESDTLDVYLPAGALSVWYEHWTAAGNQRRCDGLECTIPSPDPNEATRDVPCICARQDEQLCKPKTRLAVALPGLPFRGVWRFESGSWNVADEMSAFEPLVQQVQVGGVLKCQLIIEQRTKKKDGKTKHFSVTRLVLNATMEELASGEASLRGIPARPIMALESGGPSTREDGAVGDRPALGEIAPPGSDDDIVDAEIVDEGPTGNGQPHGLDLLDTLDGLIVTIVEQSQGVSRWDVERGLALAATDGAVDDLATCSDAALVQAVAKARLLIDGGMEVLGVYDTGRLRVKKVAV